MVRTERYVAVQNKTIEAGCNWTIARGTSDRADAREWVMTVAEGTASDVDYEINLRSMP